MDTSWIQVFVLTMSECVAPAGKTVCQEQEFDLQFLTRADCEIALEQLVTLKEESASVIIDRSKSSCAASARESAVFASLEAVSGASPKSEGWKAPDEASGKAGVIFCDTSGSSRRPAKLRGFERGGRLQDGRYHR